MFRYWCFVVFAATLVVSQAQDSSSTEIDLLRWILKNGEGVEILKSLPEGGPSFDDAENDDDVIDLPLNEDNKEQVKALLDQYLAGKLDDADNDNADLDSEPDDSEDVDADLEFEADDDEDANYDDDVDGAMIDPEDAVENADDLGAIIHHHHASRYHPIYKGRVVRQCRGNRLTRTRECCIRQKFRVYLFYHYIRFRFNSCVSLKFSKYHVYSMVFKVGRNVLEHRLITINHLPYRCYQHKGMRFCLKFTHVNYVTRRVCARLTGNIFLSPYNIPINARVGCFRMRMSEALNSTRQSDNDDLGSMNDSGDNEGGRQFPENSVKFESFANQPEDKTGEPMLKMGNPVLNLLLRKKRMN